jgi:hypothetical protein
LVTMAGSLDSDVFQDVQIFDENGVNVTPKSLAHLSVSSGVPAVVLDSAYLNPGRTVSGVSSASWKPESGPLRTAGSDANTTGDVVLDPELVDSDDDEETVIQEKGQAGVDDKTIQLMLSESDTFVLLSLPGRCVGHDTTESVGVTKRNETYAALLQTKIGSEAFIDAQTQTIDAVTKEKENQSFLYTQSTQSTQSSGWDISDASFGGDRDALARTMSRTGVGTVDAPAASAIDTRDVFTKDTYRSLATGAQQVEKALLQNLYQDKMLLYRNYSLGDVRGGAGEAVRDGGIGDKTSRTDSNPTSSSVGKAIVHLWDFVCPETKGRTVSCVSWNKSAPDLLAVGYGSLDFLAGSTSFPGALGGTTAAQDASVASDDGKSNDAFAETVDASKNKNAKGLVAFWSLKNPLVPEWVFETDHGVTAIDFSPTEFNLLAVGTRDGTVSVYDARLKNGTGANSQDASGETSSKKCDPVLKAGDGVPGKHADPVWGLRWVRVGVGVGDEVLVSISSDGRVTQWRLKKGLEFQDLMRLTRVAKRVTVGDTSGDGSKKSSTKTATSKKTTSEAYISRAGSGLCFDFNPNDCTKYIAGTEDGTIHGCATAYSETYLRDYHGHAGPVQRVAWSPFVSEVFISARYVFSFPFATFRLPDYTVCSYKLRTLRETDTFFFISPATTGV